MPLTDTLDKLNDFLFGVLAESITYNSATISALIHVDAEGRGEYMDAGQATEGTLRLSVSLDDVAAPAIGDEITYQSRDFQVVEIGEIDRVANLAQLTARRRAAIEQSREGYRHP